MSSKADKIKEFDVIINKFTRFIKGNIQKFNLPREGIDPEDVFQEVRIKIWKLLNDEKTIVNYSSYIKKIVDSSVIDHIRKMRRERGLLLQQKHKTISEWKSRYEINNIHDKNLKKILSESVESLLESRRKVVKLYLLNLTIEEIATFFSWSRDKTRNLLYRGLADLKKLSKSRILTMKLNNNDLHQIFLASIEGYIPATRKECPSPKQLLRLFRAKKSEKEKSRIIDHITGCSHCAHEFEFILKAIRYEGDMNKVVQKFIETKKIGNSSPKFSWELASLVVGASLICAIIVIFILPSRYRNLKFRNSTLSQINLMQPQKKALSLSSLYFQWEDVIDSEYYIFELYDETLYQIWSSNKIFQNNYFLSKEFSSKLKANKTYFWMISAFFPNGRKTESQLKEILLTN